MQKIYRKYPKQITFNNGLNEVIKILDLAQEELAEASACWLIGEFASEIPTCVELIKQRIDRYQNDPFNAPARAEICPRAALEFVSAAPLSPSNTRSFRFESLRGGHGAGRNCERSTEALIWPSNDNSPRFKDVQREVQLELLTAAVKIYVKYPNEGKNFIQQLLEQAAYDTQNPDVRDK